MCPDCSAARRWKFSCFVFRRKKQRLQAPLVPTRADGANCWVCEARLLLGFCPLVEKREAPPPQGCSVDEHTSVWAVMLPTASYWLHLRRCDNTQVTFLPLPLRSPVAFLAAFFSVCGCLSLRGETRALWQKSWGQRDKKSAASVKAG